MQNANAETPAMTSVPSKIEHLESKAQREGLYEELPNLSEILADLKKILHNDGQLPDYKR
jgi:hypothetical protein